MTSIIQVFANILPVLIIYASVQPQCSQFYLPYSKLQPVTQWIICIYRNQV